MSGWTIETLKEHFDALRAADQRALQIKDEGEKEAKRIKNEADTTALGLARDIQKYKDEKANELREQINRERNLYVTNEKLANTIKPLADYVANNQGVGAGRESMWIKVIQTIGLISTGIGILVFLSRIQVN